jgi:hypothetical protein
MEDGRSSVLTDQLNGGYYVWALNLTFNPKICRYRTERRLVHVYLTTVSVGYDMRWPWASGRAHYYSTVELVLPSRRAHYRNNRRGKKTGSGGRLGINNGPHSRWIAIGFRLYGTERGIDYKYDRKKIQYYTPSRTRSGVGRLVFFSLQ